MAVVPALLQPTIFSGFVCFSLYIYTHLHTHHTYKTYIHTYIHDHPCMHTYYAHTCLHTFVHMHTYMEFRALGGV